MAEFVSLKMPQKMKVSKQIALIDLSLTSYVFLMASAELGLESMKVPRRESELHCLSLINPIVTFLTRVVQFCCMNAGLAFFHLFFCGVCVTFVGWAAG